MDERDEQLEELRAFDDNERRFTSGGVSQQIIDEQELGHDPIESFDPRCSEHLSTTKGSMLS